MLMPCLTLLLAATPAASPSPHQFDFWIGEWEVRTPDGKPAGTSRIEAILGGSVIQEHWTGAKGGAGSSFISWTTPPASGVSSG